MKTRKPKAKSAKAKATGCKLSADRRMILLDQDSLRRKAASECSRAMTRLETAKAEWKRFEHEDKAGYERWRAATFGALLSQLRELEARFLEKEALVQEVEMEMLFVGARSYRDAYARVQQRRNHPPPAEPHESQAPPPPRDNDEEFDEEVFDDLDEFEQEMLFDEFVRIVLGRNPDRMKEEEYERLFADFKAKVFGQGGREAPPPPSSHPQPPQTEDSRIKEIYRLLVRRLHPDTRADSDTEVSALWHEVQDAYSTGNLERLEMLLALTDMQANATGEHTSLFQMRAVLAELRRSYNALQKNLRAAKRDPAWNFARLQDRSKLKRHVRYELTTQIKFLEDRLREIERLIAKWSAPPKPRKQNQKQKRMPEPHPDFFF